MRVRRGCLTGFLMASLSCLGQAGSTSALSVKLTVRESHGVDRINEPVTSGIPLPRSAGILSTEALHLVDPAGQTVPAQFGVLSRWGEGGGGSEGPIRWVLVDFQATVPAAGQATYLLRNDGGNPTSSALMITGHRIDTGVMSIELGGPGSSQLFERVALDMNADGMYSPAEEIVSPRSTSQMTIVSRKWRSSGLRIKEGVRHETVISSVAVEEAGPMRIAVRIDGTHKARKGGDRSGMYDFTVRLHFYKGKRFVMLVHSLRSARNGVGGMKPKSWPFRAMYLSTDLNLSANVAFTSSTGGPPVASDACDAPISLFQVSPMACELSTGNRTTRTSGQFPGWADLSDDRWGLTVALDDGWQQWPKGFEARSTTLKTFLWPDTRSTYWIKLFSRKTHRMMFSFHAGGQPDGRLLAQADRPMIALADLSWISECRAWDGHLSVPAVPIPPPHEWVIDAVNSGWANWGMGRIASDDCYACAGEHWNQMTVFGPFVQSGGVYYEMFEAAAAAARLQADQFQLWLDHPRDVIFDSPYDKPYQDYDAYEDAYWRMILPYFGLYGDPISRGEALVFPGYETYGVSAPALSHFRFAGLTECYYLTGDRTLLDAIRMYAEYTKAGVSLGYHLFGDPQGGRALFHPLYFYALAYGVSPNESYRDYSEWLIDFLWDNKHDRARGFINHWYGGVATLPNPFSQPYMAGIGQTAFYRVWENMGVPRARELLLSVGKWAAADVHPCWNAVGSGYPFTWWPADAPYVPPGYQYVDGCPNPHEGYGYNQYVQSLLPYVYEVTGDVRQRAILQSLWDGALGSYGPVYRHLGAGLYWSSPGVGEHFPEHQAIHFVLTHGVQ